MSFAYKFISNLICCCGLEKVSDSESVASTSPEELKNIRCTVRGQPPDRPKNTVTTTKYRWYTFLPLATALQFRRFGNLFYLCIIGIYAIGYYYPTVFQSCSQPFGTLFVLVFVLSVTLIFEAKDDIQRYQGDRKINKSSTKRINPNGTIQNCTWGDLRPGDVIRIEKHEHIPADIVLIASSDTSFKCYVETSGIDGETNLKIRRVPQQFVERGVSASNISGYMEYEEPNVFLQFQGAAWIDGQSDPIGIDFDSLLLRGSRLRNTRWIEGIVVYAGMETKLVMSAGRTPSKFSKIDLLLNRILGYTFAVYISLTVIFVLILIFWVPSTKEFWYFQGVDILNSYVLPGWLAYFLTFAGLLSGFIPINMYVCVEVVNFVLSLYIENDPLMYDEHSDTAANCRTTCLVAEIGQVTHIFTDKTGTLTNNEMRLVSLSIDGELYGFQPQRHSKPQPNEEIEIEIPSDVGQPPKVPICDLFPDFVQSMKGRSAVRWMMTVLAICHTVVIDVNEKKELVYNAEGPDEEAIVKGVAELGARLVATTNTSSSMAFDHDPDTLLDFRVVAVHKFTSDRKRMSVVVEELSTGKYWVFMKGADNVVLDLSDKENSKCSKATQDHVELFSLAGLRTLLVAVRELTHQEFHDWHRAYESAHVAVGEARHSGLAASAAMVETKMSIIGATAIEDSLQEGVPETIQMIRDAKIALWVLTGDKVETAVNIAFSSNIIDSHMHQILIDGNNRDRLRRELQSTINQLRRVSNDVQCEVRTRISNSDPLTPLVFVDENLDNTHLIRSNLALIVTGGALNLLLADEKGTEETQSELLQLANMCSVVIACRVSPKEKALVVRMVREGSNLSRENQPVVLAIGDGANDVPMLQEAKIGVGISGNEGLQAVNNSDFSIARFRLLKDLLIVHGRWNYQRCANLVKYSIYTWYIYEIPTILFLFVCMVSGEMVTYNTYYQTVYALEANALITAICWFQRDISRETALLVPQCYEIGRTNKYLDARAFVSCIFRGVCHSAILLFCCFHIIPNTYSMASLGALIYTAMFAVVFARQMLLTVTWNWLLVFLTFCLLANFWFSIFICDKYLGPDQTAFLFQSDSWKLYQHVILTAIIVVCFDYTVYGLPKLLFPDQSRILREYDRYFLKHYAAFAEEDAPDSPRSFSQEEDTTGYTATSARRLLEEASSTDGTMQSFRRHRSFVNPV